MTEKKTTTKKATAKATASKSQKAAKLPPMPKGDRVVAMIHFNTPEITEAAVQSIRKHGGERYEIVIYSFRKFASALKALSSAFLSLWVWTVLRLLQEALRLLALIRKQWKVSL